MTDFKAALTALVEADVKFILVGGAAATAHGSARLTQDLDVVYARDRDNITKLCAALRPHAPLPKIEVKRAAGRPKDLEAIAELEALLEERGGS